MDNKFENIVRMYDRKSLEVTGVTNVVSYDEEEISVESKEGNIVIKGKDLQILNLNLEDNLLSVGGYIIKLEYIEDKGENFRKRSKGIFSRLLK